ncbi:MAG: NAD(P)/FAD-dependent oxidoreductase [Thermonemataceae bacterium]
MLSFWEKQHFIHYDYIIVGGGIVGLSTAASLLSLRPDAAVLVLERGLFPTGASTKNAGFACFGSLTEILADIKKIGEDAAGALIEQRWQGLQQLQQRLGPQRMGLQALGGYELLTTANESAIEQLEPINQLLKSLFGTNIFSLKKSLITAFGFSKEIVTQLVYNDKEAQVDTGLLMRHLWRYVQEKGATLLTGAQVENIEENDQAILLHVTSSATQETICFSAERAALCTNAFTKKLLPDISLQPGRGQVLITTPVKDLPFQGTFHMEEGFFYFRNVGNRVLFGGGRHLDYAAETTTDFSVTEKIINALEDRLSNIILPNKEYKIAQQWAGIMAFNAARKPLLKALTSRLLIGTCLNGMGIAIGSSLGDRLAKLLLDSQPYSYKYNAELN